MKKRGRPRKNSTTPLRPPVPDHDRPPDSSTTPKKDPHDSLTTDRSSDLTTEQIIEAAKATAGEGEPLLGTVPEKADQDYEALAKSSAVLLLTTIKELRTQVKIEAPWPEYIEPPFIHSFVGLCKKYNLSPDVGPELMMFGCLLIIGKDFYAAYTERKAKQKRELSGGPGPASGDGKRRHAHSPQGSERDS